LTVTNSTHATNRWRLHQTGQQSNDIGEFQKVSTWYDITPHSNPQHCNSIRAIVLYASYISLCVPSSVYPPLCVLLCKRGVCVCVCVCVSGWGRGVYDVMLYTDDRTAMDLSLFMRNFPVLHSTSHYSTAFRCTSLHYIALHSSPLISSPLLSSLTTPLRLLSDDCTQRICHSETLPADLEHTQHASGTVSDPRITVVR
jgi:hypothetical protein